MARIAAPVPPGTVFSELTIIREVDRSKNNDRRFLCRCSCGTEKVAYVGNLRSGRVISCGCVHRRTMVQANYAKECRRREGPPLKKFDGGRTCTTCQKWKPWDDFRLRKTGLNGRDDLCRSCHNTRLSCRKFGITPDEWKLLFDSQGGVCGVCEEVAFEQELGWGGRRLSVDHDHACCPANEGCRNCIRGLLCTGCNLALGLAERVPRFREALGFYLDRRPLVDGTLAIATVSA